MRKLLTALLLAAPLAAQTFFIQGSDPQFGMHAKDANFVQETANFEFFIASVNRLKPAFVVVTGDLTNKPGDAEQVAEYHRIAKKLSPGIKLYSVAGNHDVGNEPTPESLARYRKDYGPDWYAFDSGPIHGIVLDSSVIAFPGKVAGDAAKQKAWLAGELHNAAGKQIVVFQHIPFFLEKADEPDQYFNIPLETRKEYLRMFHEAGVRYIFTGHYHRNAGGKDGELEEIVTGPVGMPLGQEGSGFRIIMVNATDLTHTWIPLNAIPNTWPPPPVP